MKEKVVFAWSSGKDSARALHEIRQDDQYDVTSLLTTVTEGYERISMHGVRVALVEQQAESIGLLLEKVYIPKEASNENYETAMRNALLRHKEKGVIGIAFGDLFLEDLKVYRENKLAEVGMKAIFPLWKRDTTELARSFIKQGFRAIITCVDSQVLGKEFSGRFYDRQFLADLPSHVDSCGENGEFHSFVFDGPLFRRPVRFEKGEVVVRDNRFHFCELLPV
ncbi:MAG: diphthine--ammonia ligase [Nitrospirota bacterium]|nr:diphthine--ammonia ligase [Nitrospirota bacterium]